MGSEDGLVHEAKPEGWKEAKTKTIGTQQLCGV